MYYFVTICVCNIYQYRHSYECVYRLQSKMYFLLWTIVKEVEINWHRESLDYALYKTKWNSTYILITHSSTIKCFSHSVQQQLSEDMNNVYSWMQFSYFHQYSGDFTDWYFSIRTYLNFSRQHRSLCLNNASLLAVIPTELAKDAKEARGPCDPDRPTYLHLIWAIVWRMQRFSSINMTNNLYFL